MKYLGKSINGGAIVLFTEEEYLELLKGIEAANGKGIFREDYFTNPNLKIDADMVNFLGCVQEFIVSNMMVNDFIRHAESLKEIFKLKKIDIKKVNLDEQV